MENLAPTIVLRYMANSSYAIIQFKNCFKHYVRMLFQMFGKDFTRLKFIIFIQINSIFPSNRGDRSVNGKLWKLLREVDRDTG